MRCDPVIEKTPSVFDVANGVPGASLAREACVNRNSHACLKEGNSASTCAKRRQSSHCGGDAPPARARTKTQFNGSDINRVLSGQHILVACLIGISGIGGCNYMVGGPYRQDIRTVHVPIFESTSFRRGVEFQLTEAVHKEIQKQTHFRLVKSVDADSRLTGQIVQISKPPLSESAYDDSRELQWTMAVQVTWTDLRTGREEQQKIPIAPADVVYLLSTADFAPELGQSQATARQQAVERLARQIVRMMQFPW